MGEQRRICMIVREGMCLTTIDCYRSLSNVKNLPQPWLGMKIPEGTKKLFGGLWNGKPCCALQSRLVWLDVKPKNRTLRWEMVILFENTCTCQTGAFFYYGYISFCRQYGLNHIRCTTIDKLMHESNVTHYSGSINHLVSSMFRNR